VGAGGEEAWGAAKKGEGRGKVGGRGGREEEEGGGGGEKENGVGERRTYVGGAE